MHVASHCKTKFKSTAVRVQAKLHRQAAEGAKEKKSFTAKDAKGTKENNPPR